MYQRSPDTIAKHKGVNTFLSAEKSHISQKTIKEAFTHSKNSISENPCTPAPVPSPIPIRSAIKVYEEEPGTRAPDISPKHFSQPYQSL